METTVGTVETQLSSKQSACLYTAIVATDRDESIDPWAHGSTTIAVLKRLGFIVAIKGDRCVRYQATAAGYAWFGIAGRMGK